LRLVKLLVSYINKKQYVVPSHQIKKNPKIQKTEKKLIEIEIKEYILLLSKERAYIG
jgi:hypothetical protein